MDTWTPIWSKIVDSSLWGEPDYVVKVFMTMLAKKDYDFVVRGGSYEISRWARKDEAEVIEALEILSRPDKKRLEPQDYDGRRIERVEDGWLILNGEKYREAIRTIKRRAQQAENQRNYRLRKKLAGGGTLAEKLSVKAVANGDDETVKRLDELQSEVPVVEKKGELSGQGEIVPCGTQREKSAVSFPPVVQVESTGDELVDDEEEVGEEEWE